MDYRDERDALRARVESLEGQLSTAQAELERMRATEMALDASKRETQRLRAELERLRPTQPRNPQGRLWLFIAAGTGLMAASFAVAILLRAKPAPVPAPLTAPSTFFPRPQRAPIPPVEPVEPAEPIPPAKVAEPVEPARRAHAEWNATVVSAQGAAPGIGGACKILAELHGDGADAGVDEVEVVCGTKTLYRSTDTFSGMSNNARGVTESAGKTPGTLRHTLMFQDQGTRTGRAQISLDTGQRSGVVWSENVPAFRVELRMEPDSLPRTGEPLIDEANRRERLAAAINRGGKITKLEGNPGVPEGTTCALDVSPVSSGDNNCRVRIRCGGKLLYGEGQSGYNQCTIREGRVGRLVDDRPSSVDSDPQLDMDLSENTVTVSDDTDPPWKAQIALTPAPR